MLYNNCEKLQNLKLIHNCEKLKKKIPLRFFFIKNMCGDAVSFLLGRMAFMLEKEASLIQGVGKEINELRLELGSIQAFLKDVQRKKDSSEGLRFWVKELRDIAHEAEDIIDEYTSRMAERHGGGFKSYLNGIVNLPRSICYRHQTAVRLQETKAKVISLSEKAKRYGLDRIEQEFNSNEETRLRLAESSPCAEEDVVGIEENKDLLIRWLTDEDKKRKVYSVVGMGGLGKTTLVANVYRNQQVKKHFHCHAWITVSQSYKHEELLRSMIRGFCKPNVPDGIGEMDRAQLVEMLCDFLQGKSLFPEDYLIFHSRLVRLFVAEGFVEERGDLTMEDVAETYIKELILRSMLQSVRANDFKRAHSSYQMHDLMRDLAISVAKEENFCVVHDKKETKTDVRPRRMMIHYLSENIPLCGNMSRLRSFIVFVKDVISPCSLTRISSYSRLLRVLDLQDSHIESVPEELGNLINLHYLSLRSTNVKVLPRSLGRLRNLQTLDLRNSKVKNLPNCVEKLIKLRHLLVCFNFLGVKAPTGICKIESLQTVSGVDASDEIVQQIGKLNQLKRFEILNVRKDHCNDLFSSIQNMKCLLELSVVAADDAEILDLEGLSSPPTHINLAFLRAHLKKLPDWMGNMEHLRYLCLHKTQLRTDPFSSIQVLPSLMHLELYKAFDGLKLCFTDGSFPALRRLYLLHFIELKCVEIENGAMPCIQELYFADCCALKKVPEGIQFLTCLQKLQVQNMHKEFMEKLRGDGRTVCPSVDHIPIIKHIHPGEGVHQYFNSRCLTSF